MTTLLPTDDDNHPIPALGFKDGGAHSIAVTAASARNSAPFDANTKIVSLYATGPVFIRLGDESVTAGTEDHYFPGGVYYDIAVDTKKTNGSLYIAAVRADTDCTLYISEKG